MPRLTLSVLIVFLYGLPAFPSELSKIAVRDSMLVEVTGKNCGTCIVVLTDTQDVSIKDYYYRDGLEVKQIHYFYAGGSSGVYSSMEIYENNVLKEMRKNAGSTDTSAYGVFRYYDGDNLFEKGKMVHSKKEGLWEIFYLSGTRKSRCTYSGGAMNGAYAEYYENGKIKLEGNWLNNMKDEYWSEYDSLGNKLRWFHYINDKLFPASPGKEDSPREFMAAKLKAYGITENDLSGCIQFVNAMSQEAKHIVSTGDHMYLEANATVILDGKLKAIKGNFIYVSLSNMLGVEENVTRVDKSQIKVLGYVNTGRAIRSMMEPRSTRTFKKVMLDDPEYQISFDEICQAIAK